MRHFRVGDRARVRGLFMGKSDCGVFEGEKVIVTGTSKDGTVADIELVSDGSFSTEIHVKYLRMINGKTFSDAYDRTLAKALERIGATSSKVSMAVLKNDPATKIDGKSAWVAWLRAEGHEQYKGTGDTPYHALRSLLRAVEEKHTSKSLHVRVVAAVARRHESDAGAIEITTHCHSLSYWIVSVHIGRDLKYQRSADTPEKALENLLVDLKEKGQG